jgi:endo-1,4-beta-D-glucanase Y
VLVASVSASGCGAMSSPDAYRAARLSPAAATIPAARFIARYVTSDGRVVRHDQGGDIVSEGQAYGMLIAEIAGKPTLMRAIWSWTEAHLGRPDGLFAWHATGAGQIEDPQSATDADVLIAYALLRYQGPDQTALHGAGRRVAHAVLAHESVALADGDRLPVAGPWARLTSPPVVDPSYLMPGVFVALARLTGDGSWNGAATAAVRSVAGLTGGGARLPSDWAQLSAGRLVPIAEPGGGAGVQYGLDAMRVPIWFATGCDHGARRLAASWWRGVLRSNGRSAQTALSLTGASINPQSSPVALLAAAAAATAAGDRSAANELRIQADSLALRTPTYYGDAWAALAPALLDGALGPCGEVIDG